MKELDVLLSHYVEFEYAQAPEPEQAAFRELLDAQDPEIYAYQLALKEARNRDPRFIQVDRLGELTSLIADCKMQLAQKSEEKQKREVLDSYARAFDKEKESQKEEAAGSRPLVLVGLAALASAMLNPVLSFAAKFAASELGLGQFAK